MTVIDRRSLRRPRQRLGAYVACFDPACKTTRIGPHITLGQPSGPETGRFGAVGGPKIRPKGPLGRGCKPVRFHYDPALSRGGLLPRYPVGGRSSGVEHDLAKVGVEGSNPFARSIILLFLKQSAKEPRRTAAFFARLGSGARWRSAEKPAKLCGTYRRQPTF